MKSEWTDQQVAALKIHYANGLSAAEIGAEIGVSSRNAVIGKIHRLGLNGSRQNRPPKEKSPQATPAPGLRKSRRISVSAPQPKAEPLPTTPVAHGFRHVQFLDLQPGDCRFPDGETTITFCGAPRTVGGPYCAHHCTLAYTRPGALTADERRERTRAYRASQVGA